MQAPNPLIPGTEPLALTSSELNATSVTMSGAIRACNFRVKKTGSMHSHTDGTLQVSRSRGSWGQREDWSAQLYSQLQTPSLNPRLSKTLGAPLPCPWSAPPL